MHKHHLLPKRLGGSDEPDNLTPPISNELHAEFHRDLWEHYGHWGDFIAWKALSGRMTNEEARLTAAKEGQSRSDKYKSRKMRDHLASIRTTETCSRGGKAASKSLVAWQAANKEAHKLRCAALGRASAAKLVIPHKYQDVVYPSKKALQAATGLSNCGFYGKLSRGEIERVQNAAKG